MGSTLASQRLQGRCQTLSTQAPLVASVVPDVSGIDKIFDYLVPDEFHSRVALGTRVRVNLNGRRVAGWVVDLARHGEREQHIDVLRLAPLVSVSGAGVEPQIVPLTKWVSQEFFGSWRATLSFASAPRMRDKAVHAHFGQSPTLPTDEVSAAVPALVENGGGLLVVPPLVSALSVVATLAGTGPVLVVCPTVRMAAMGAAALRRRGLTAALVPDDWEKARAGVDVVIGARSSVFAPCANVSAIVVIDEHDESLHEERSPAWNAVSVARQRALSEEIPLILTSSVPSARALHECSQSTVRVHSAREWPRIEVVDLGDVPVAGSLLSSQLLSSVAQSGVTTVCVLNTKGKARLIVCKACRVVQACPQCSSLLTQDDNDALMCIRCNALHGSVCIGCGRSAFIVPRGGISQLRTQVEASSTNPVIEVSSDTQDTWTKGSVFIGTEAVLFRVPSADCVVFADLDRDLGAPRLSAQSEVLSLIAKAARIVGTHGQIIIQTRQPHHPLMMAFAQQNISDALRGLSEADLAQRKVFNMPPFSRVVRITLSTGRTIDEVSLPHGIEIARENESLLLRTSSAADLADAIAILRLHFGSSLRVHADPQRF